MRNWNISQMYFDTKLQTNSTISKIQHLQKIQNTNYAIYIKYKIRFLVVWKCLTFSSFFPKCRKHFCIVDVFCTIIVILNIVFEFVVLNSIWEHGLKQMFDIFRKRSKHVAEVWTILVRNIWGNILWIFINSGRVT